MAGPEINPEPLAQPRHIYTHEEEWVEHIISDDQLMQLSRGGSTTYLEWSVGALGIAAGFFQNLIAAASAIADSKALEVWDSIGSGLFFIAATTFIICALSHQRTRFNVGDLVERIRARKVGIMSGPGQPIAGGEPFVGGDSTGSTVSAGATD